MVDNESLFKFLVENVYLTPRDIMYKGKYPFCLSPFDFNEFLKYKDAVVKSGKNPLVVALPLKTFDDRPLHYFNCQELLWNRAAISELVADDLASNGSLVTSRLSEHVQKSRIYSEMDGTLSIEAVKTTRRRVADIASGAAAPIFESDFVIKNMARGIDYVLGKPPFGKDSLRHLYSLLSDGLLEDDYKLGKSAFYRHDGVEVDGFLGCPVPLIEDCMDSFFDYANRVLEKGSAEERFLLPHIAHYYLVYVHPYFDYNGRTARMVSFWLALLSGVTQPLFISEAINQTKNRYYNSLRDTRGSHNDLTYFLIYLLSTSVDYYLCYENIEAITQKAKDGGVVLSETEKAYLKKILLCEKGGFVYGDFIRFINSPMSKQAALKMLNFFERIGALRSMQGKGRNKIFFVNRDYAPYRRKTD